MYQSPVPDLADRVGFEPTSLCRVIISDARRKIKCVFDRKFIYNLQIYLYNYIDKIFGGAIIYTD